MNPAAILFVLIASTALLGLPQRWAPLPPLLAACYITVGQVIQIGPFQFYQRRIEVRSKLQETMPAIRAHLLDLFTNFH